MLKSISLLVMAFALNAHADWAPVVSCTQNRDVVDRQDFSQNFQLVVRSPEVVSYLSGFIGLDSRVNAKGELIVPMIVTRNFAGNQMFDGMVNGEYVEVTPAHDGTTLVEVVHYGYHMSSRTVLASSTLKACNDPGPIY